MYPGDTPGRQQAYIFLGNDNFTHAASMEEVWEPVNFKPDELYNQVVFSFHEYTNAYNPDVTAPVLGHVQNTYNVPVFCTEFGDADVVGGLTTEMRRKFETDMFAMFKPRKIGWTIWTMLGNPPNYTEPRYFDIWEPAVVAQGSPIPQQGTAPAARKIFCRAMPGNILADGVSTTTIAAVIQDNNGERMFEVGDTVTFSLTGTGVLLGNISVAAMNGIAMIQVQSGNASGIATVSANSGALTPGSVDVICEGVPVKINGTVSPGTLLADGSSFSLLSVSVVDDSNNVVTSEEGTVNFTVTGPATLWADETIPANSRQLVNGRTTILVKAGSVKGDTVIAAVVGSLESDNIAVKIRKNSSGKSISPEKTEPYPNPCDFKTGNEKMTFVVSSNAGGTVKIYTLDGALVKALTVSVGANAEWNSRNEDGEKVSRGIYVYVLRQANRDKITGKLGIN